MYIILLKYIKPLEAVDAAISAHIEYLDKYYNQEKFILSGRRNPRNGGVILCNAGDQKEVEAIIAEDPFHIGNIAEYEIIEFQPTKGIPELADLIS
ncbi:YciI family protein [Acetobacterium tundrae]|uniref:GTP cyclohydrolase n=1 Tax=Acetobacterium tundrae TaxID=132932 RepID=A0ABR6WHY2_9FIRM|nr:YciI family protein [Acetobacterium tundrae]MBC3796094.1 GTP cyclohydrolase [Acetobacterium tundrae]